MTDIIQLKDETFVQLRDFIYDKSGIFITQSKKYLIENRLLRVIQEQNLRGFEEYLYLVRYGANGSELTRLFDAITTNETYFFREPQQFQMFEESLVPVLAGLNGGRLRIWSAACSTGEEPYTVAMILHARNMAARAEISGSDISAQVLESARRGIYNSYAVRNVPEPYMKKYFRQNGQDYELDRSVRNMVRLKNINLMDRKKTAEMSGLDVVFCRNVLIYFDDRSKQKAVSHIYDSLRPGGFLFIGTSESLHNVTRAFKPVTINKVVVYQKV